MRFGIHVGSPGVNHTHPPLPFFAQGKLVLNACEKTRFVFEYLGEWERDDAMNIDTATDHCQWLLL